MNTDFGTKHNFALIKDINEFRQRVPISTYDSYDEFIRIIRRGTKNVLTKEDITLLEPTSGSSSHSKYVPYNNSLKEEFRNGLIPWLYDIYSKRPKLLSGAAYWSITPILNNKKAGKGKIAVGFEDDTEYFGFPQNLLVKLALAVPSDISKIRNIIAFKYITLLFLLKNKNLTFISIWNPTFLKFLFESLNKWSGFLVEDIKNGTITPPVNIDAKTKNRLLKKLQKDEKRAIEIARILDVWKTRKMESGKSMYKDIWPNLELISCWTDGNSAQYKGIVEDLFPGIEIQGKGLIATEGFVSLPLTGEKAPILAVNSHFFEFIDIQTGDIKLAHELTVNKKYSVVITTSGGLYRYRLQDVIQVIGYKGQAPLLRFINKENNISDIFGEKINQGQVSIIFKKLLKHYNIDVNFFMLSYYDDTNNNSYVIYLEFKKQYPIKKLKLFREVFEKELRKNYHYNYCRILNQLAKVRLFRIKSNGINCFIHTNQKMGQKLGNIKPMALSKDFDWPCRFNGEFIN